MNEKSLCIGEPLPIFFFQYVNVVMGNPCPFFFQYVNLVIFKHFHANSVVIFKQVLLRGALLKFVMCGFLHSGVSHFLSS